MEWGTRALEWPAFMSQPSARVRRRFFDRHLTAKLKSHGKQYSPISGKGTKRIEKHTIPIPRSPKQLSGGLTCPNWLIWSIPEANTNSSVVQTVLFRLADVYLARRVSARALSAAVSDIGDQVADQLGSQVTCQASTRSP